MGKRRNHEAFRKDIDVPLTVAGINNAIKEIEKIRKELNDAMQELCEILLEDGAFHARVEISRLNAVDTGALMASIGYGAYDPVSKAGIVYAGGYYAFFVEFGTGIVGEEHPHPGLATGEVDDFAVLGSNGSVYTGYDTNGHGESGWIYRKVGEKKMRWTKGMPARPFMYNTFTFLREWAKKIGGDVIAEFIW